MKRILIVLGIALIFAIWCFISVFFIGGYRVEGIYKTTLTENYLNITGSSSGSGDAFAGYSYEIKADSVYVKVRYVLVSKFFRSAEFDIKIEDDFSDVKRVYITNGKENRLVYEAVESPV